MKCLIGKTAFWSVFGLFTVFGCFVTFLVYGQQIKTGQPTKVCNLYFSNGVVLLSIPVAETQEQQARGLSHHENAGGGMLFSWAKSEQRVFWMRDTHVPLSVGYLDSTGVLFAIDEMKPNSDKFYFSLLPALEALELGQNEFQKKGLTVGVQLIRRDCF